MIYAAPITSIYAALLGFMFTAITLRIVLVRNTQNITLGDGGNKPFEKLIRGHGNFTETVPLALILMLLLEQQGATNITMHTLGVALLAGRIFHYLQLSGTLEPPLFRVIGMVLTLSTIIGASTRLLFGY